MLSYREAQLLLATNCLAMPELIAHGCLAIREFSDAHGGQRTAILAESVKLFQQSNISLAEISKANRTHPGKMRSRLESEKIRPIYEPGKANTRFYRRSEVRHLIS